jgi:hypothetical protein
MDPFLHLNVWARTLQINISRLNKLGNLFTELRIILIKKEAVDFEKLYIKI